jgi:hypothetical protein
MKQPRLLVCGTLAALLAGCPSLLAATSSTARAAATLRPTAAALATTNLTTRTGATRRDLVALELDRNVFRGTNLTVLRRAAPGTLSTAAVVRPGPTEAAVRLPPLEQAVVFTGSQSATGRLARGKAEFPGRLLVTTTPEKPRRGAVFLEPRTSPLPWDAKARAYATRLVAGVDMADSQEPVELRPPVVIQFFAEQAAVSPPSVTITQSGTGGYREVELACRKTAAQPQVTARSDFGELRQTIPLESLGFVALLEGILPLRFLLVALIGGGLGGLLRAADRRRPWKAAQAVNFVWQGAAVGLVTVCVISAGMGLVNVPVDVVGAEVGVFAVSALAGLTGVALLHQFKRKAFGGGAANDA